MAVNTYQPHIYVLSEDQANRNILTGFLLSVPKNTRQIQALPFKRGKFDVLGDFRQVYESKLRNYEYSFAVLLLDFDNNAQFGQQILERIDEAVRDRVFVLGAIDEPERLRSELGNFETIGGKLAADCIDQTAHTWGHAQLKHNLIEIKRMPAAMRAILFD